MCIYPETRVLFPETEVRPTCTNLEYPRGVATVRLAVLHVTEVPRGVHVLVQTLVLTVLRPAPEPVGVRLRHKLWREETESTTCKRQA